jgi:TRAP-type mannitol/chloroaromatic compound transport system substrate-binding protein
LVENEGVIAKPLPEAVVSRLKEVTNDTLLTMSNSDAQMKKVYDSYMSFKDKHESWAALSEKPLLNM